MNTASLKPLFITTLQKPREAAAQVLGLQLPSQALWIALSLVSVVTSLTVAAMLQAGPPPTGDLGALIQASPAYTSPLIFAIMQWGRAVLSVFMLFWVGKSLGGRGELVDILGVVTWLQVVSFVLVAALSLVGVLIPFLSSLGMLVFFVWWVWAIVAFLDVAHQFENPFKALVVLVASIIGVLVGLSIIMGVIGGLFMGSQVGVN
ncbi:MAG: Yip1 family protein [Pseudomonadota bacterium]